jgi:hypothetical protein
MKSVAICYHGLTRSTKKIYKSHHNNLFNILKENNIFFDVYMHTWSTNDNLIWCQKSDIPIDYEEYKLLQPNYYEISNQDDFLNVINFSDYFNKELYNKYGADAYHEWEPLLIRNYLCALESQKRVTNMVLNNNNNNRYDFIIYIRPDVMIYTPFNINFLNINHKSISIPNYDHYSGYNDKFAIININECSNYGKRIDEIIEFKKTHGAIVSEKYTKFIIDKYFENINFIDFKFEIIRP